MSSFLCPYPWNMPCLATSGSFRVCPASQSSLTKGLVQDQGGLQPRIQDQKTASEILNSASLKDLRRRMIAREDVSDTCQRCLSEEAAGTNSLRKIEIEKFPEFTEAAVRDWTESDGTLKNETPIWNVILRLGNKCNLTCRMCGPSSSSAWYKEFEATRHRGFKEDGERIALEKNIAGGVQAVPDVYAWTEDETILNFIRSCGLDLKQLHFSGGEPLLSRSHLEILKYLVENKKASDISLEYISNLTVLTDEVLELWAHFKFVGIGVSIEGPPLVNEYIRYPLKADKFLANLKKLDAANIRGRFWLTTTVQIYNVLYLQELADWLRSQNFKKINAQISWHVLRAPKELSIFALPLASKVQVAERLKDSAEFGKIADMIFSQDDSSYFPKFLESTAKMDSYRGQSLASLTVLHEVLAKAPSYA